MTEAFEFLETMVEAGKIGSYGITTYNSMRVKHTSTKVHLSLQKMDRLAQKVVGEGKRHNMRFI
jgi:hypothetical protein